MDVRLSRRTLCRLTAGLSLALPLYRLAAAPSGGKQYFVRVDAAQARAALPEGALVLVDTRISRFEGNGLYVYPDWGNPTVYEVRQESRRDLGFYHPGSKQRLWKMNAANPAARFSGRASGYLLPGETPASDFPGELAELRVPSLPVA